jgi:hypothetical protein
MLDFDPAEHRYSIDGRTILSVTKILELSGVIDYSRIPWDIREFALARGSAVHLATQYLDQGVLAEDSLDRSISGYVDAWKRFRSETGWENLLVEFRGYHRAHDYAGTADRIGWFPGQDDHLAVLDIKTGSAPGWVALQLAAYSDFVAHATYDRVSVELHADGSYRIRSYPVQDRRRHLADFLACRRVIQLRGEKWI